MTDELMSPAEWMGTGEVPVARSFAEICESAFREQDLADKRMRQRSQQLTAERQAAAQDATDIARFLGKGHSHADVIAGFAAASDAIDAWEEHQRSKEQARLARAREERIERLEGELATSHTRSERMSRTLREANEGWGRARAEAASFRDNIYRSYYG